MVHGLGTQQSNADGRTMLEVRSDSPGRVLQTQPLGDTPCIIRARVIEFAQAQGNPSTRCWATHFAGFLFMRWLATLFVWWVVGVVFALSHALEFSVAAFGSYTANNDRVCMMAVGEVMAELATDLIQPLPHEQEVTTDEVKQPKARHGRKLRHVLIACRAFHGGEPAIEKADKLARGKWVREYMRGEHGNTYFKMPESRIDNDAPWVTVLACAPSTGYLAALQLEKSPVVVTMWSKLAAAEQDATFVGWLRGVDTFSAALYGSNLPRASKLK